MAKNTPSLNDMIVNINTYSIVEFTPNNMVVVNLAELTRLDFTGRGFFTVVITVEAVLVEERDLNMWRRSSMYWYLVEMQMRKRASHVLMCIIFDDGGLTIVGYEGGHYTPLLNNMITNINRYSIVKFTPNNTIITNLAKLTRLDFTERGFSAVVTTVGVVLAEERDLNMWRRSSIYWYLVEVQMRKRASKVKR
ncbi:hypothetical protein Q3G72_003618 [Acer saccharum]|nr:hypothetical protein Q3G72_003618 [Acer saccharum]